jgi:hypothetical protein
MSVTVFEGKVLVLTGRFTAGEAKLQEELEALGARIASHVSLHIDFLITGEHPDAEMMDAASSQGINLLTEEEVHALMRGEEVDVDRAGKRGERSVDELLGQARGLLDRPMSPAIWTELVALLDACQLSQQEVLVNYLEPQLGRWERPDVRARAQRVFAMQALASAGGDDEEREEVKNALYFVSRQPAKSIRYAPEHWMGEMMQGVPSPKYRLVCDLDLRFTNAPQEKIHQMLIHPELTGLSALSLHASDLPSRDNIAAILGHDNFAGIHFFSPGNVGLRRVKQITVATETRLAPRVLDFWDRIESHSTSEEKMLSALVRAPCSEHVETLILSQGGPTIRHLIEEITEHGLLPRLRTLVWSAFGPTSSWFQRMRPICERVDTLVLPHLCYGESESSGWQAYLACDLPESIATISVGTMSYEQHTEMFTNLHMLFAPDEIVERAFGELCDSALLRRIKHIDLGPLFFDERVTSILAEQRPDIELLV